MAVEMSKTLWKVIIIIMFLSTGSLNTLAAKWANTMSAEGDDGNKIEFRHSFLQSWGMFLGECLCLLTFILLNLCVAKPTVDPQTEAIKKPQEPKLNEDAEQGPETNPEQAVGLPFSPYWLLVPAMLDLVATSSMYIGLTMTTASSYQMLRGSDMVFTAILSRFIFNQKIGWLRASGIMLVVVGLVTVGLTDQFFMGDEVPNSDPVIAEEVKEEVEPVGVSYMVVGDLIIVAAQILVACQVVFEEKFVRRYEAAPLQVVGWQGVFGFIAMSILLVPFYFIKVDRTFGQNPRSVLEDALHGFAQLGNEPLLALAYALTVISIAFFNFAGITITKEVSATSRKVMDSFRTVIIWVVSLSVKWQRFAWLHLLGFFFLVCGMFIYNQIIIEPFVRYLMDKFSKKSDEPPAEMPGDEKPANREE